MYTALLSAISHYVFFDQLHGSIASGVGARISQSYATAVSLLLVTLFKASLLGCVGVCSAQYLWRVLRGNPIAVSTVESLFQMRHNPLELFNYRVIMTGSFLLAAFTWIVPLAAIYPPGALTITATPVPETGRTRMSVPELVIPQEFDPLRVSGMSKITEFTFEHKALAMSGKGEPLPNVVNMSTTVSPQTPSNLLLRVSKAVILTGEIMQEPSPFRKENTSYSLSFVGPQLSCQRVEHYNHSALLFNRSEPFADLVLGDKNSQFPIVRPWPIQQNRFLGAMACKDGRGIVHGVENKHNLQEYLLQTTKTNCTVRYVSYQANVTYVKGVRSIDITKRELQPQPVHKDMMTFNWEASRDALLAENDLPRVSDKVFLASSTLNEFKARFRDQVRWWQSYTIYTAFLQTITTSTYRECVDYKDARTRCSNEWTRPNGTRVPIGPISCNPWKGSPVSEGPSQTIINILEDSRLNPYRFSLSLKFSENSSINLTEAALNELLTNVTISLMTLDIWTDNVDVNWTVYYNTYDFSQPANLIVPYALCLAFGLLIVALGLRSLWLNGVPATDGFMQVMIATRGRTEMETMVLQEELVDPSKASKELKNLKVRYGELVVEDAMDGKRVWGFGTAEETISLRKKK
jgi:hypothetical protein